MRTIYICSFCNRHHDTRHGALACENKHQLKPELPLKDYRYIEQVETYGDKPKPANP